MQTQGTINLKIKDDMWKKLYTNPFVAIFQIGGQEYLERLTATSGDDSIVDTLAEEIGLPKNFSRLTDTLIQPEQTGSISFELSDGEMNFQQGIETKRGLNVLVKSAIRILGSLDKTDEF